MLASSTITWAAVTGLVFFGLGVAFSETVKGGIAAGFSASARRREHGQEMRKVVLEVDPEWTGSGYSYRGLDVAVLEATVRVANHGSALIKNVRARMHKRPTGVESARMVPAIPAGGVETITITRDLGLIDDQPFDDEEDWLNHYWFEADFEDTKGQRWLVTYNPRDEKQTVERMTGI
jgi:hypothetical protein